MAIDPAPPRHARPGLAGVVDADPRARRDGGPWLIARRPLQVNGSRVVEEVRAGQSTVEIERRADEARTGGESLETDGGRRDRALARDAAPGSSSSGASGPHGIRALERLDGPDEDRRG